MDRYFSASRSNASHSLAIRAVFIDHDALADRTCGEGSEHPISAFGFTGRIHGVDADYVLEISSCVGTLLDDECDLQSGRALILPFEERQASVEARITEAFIPSLTRQ